MHRVGAGRRDGGQHRIGVQIRLGRRGPAQRHGLIGQSHVHCPGVSLREHRDGGDAEIPAAPDHPNGDLPAVGDENLGDHPGAAGEAAEAHQS